MFTKRLVVNTAGFVECGKRSLRRYRQGRPLTEQEELALHTVFYAFGKSREEFKRWLASAASPAIDKEVGRVAGLSPAQLAKFVERAESRLGLG